MADLTEKQIAIGNGPPAAEPTIYVACHQCDDCGHIGINDEAAPEDGQCRHCAWYGPHPQDDTCPNCGRDSCIESICPQCNGLYVLLVEDHIPCGAALPDGSQR